MRIVLIHGFNVKDGGASTVDRLAPYLIKAGHFCDMDEADYGWIGLLGVRLRKHAAVRRIAHAIETADVIISHSNGANYETKALKLHQRHKPRYQIIRLSPALNSKEPVPTNVDRGTVFFSRSDFWVWLSGFLPAHPWGRQGQHGYTGTDTRIDNRDFSDLIKGHSDWFSDENIEFIAKEIILTLEQP